MRLATQYNGDMRTTGTKRAIRNAFYRLGLHTTPKAVVQALGEQGIPVDEEVVRQVRFEVLKETTGARVGKVSRSVGSPVVRRCPKGFPGRRCHG
jgi:hypothetical protein